MVLQETWSPISSYRSNGGYRILKVFESLWKTNVVIQQQNNFVEFRLQKWIIVFYAIQKNDTVFQLLQAVCLQLLNIPFIV